MSLRNSPIPGTQLTPFEANFGRPMRVPAQTFIVPKAPQRDDWPADIRDYVEDLQQRLKLIQETTAKNREANNEVMKQNFDQRFARPHVYQSGDSVWLKQFAYEPGSSRKLNKPWQEQAYTIESVISPQEVTLRNQRTGELLKNKVATNNIKIAYLRTEQLRKLESDETGTGVMVEEGTNWFETTSSDNDKNHDTAPSQDQTDSLEEQQHQTILKELKFPQ